MSPRISVFPPPGDARLVLVGFSDARSVESKRVAPPSIAGFYQPGGDECCATERFFGLDFGRITPLYTLLGACHGVQVMIETAMGRVTLPNRMIFRKTSKGEGVIFNPKIYIADFGNFKQGFSIMNLSQNSNFKVCFFNNCIDIN